MFWEHFGAKPWPAFSHQNFGFFSTPQGFGSILERNLAKTLRGPKKTKVLLPTRWRVPKNQKKTQSFGALGIRLQKLFWDPQRFGTKTLFFWDPPWFWQGFAPKGSQNLEGTKKQQSFNAGGSPKNRKKQSFGALGSLAAPDSNTFFWFFWDPPACWHQNFGFLGTLHGLGKALLQKAPKTLRGTNKNQSFGAKMQEGPKKHKNTKF